MEDKIKVKKTKGAWMITVKGCVEKKDTSEQSSNHQNQRASEKMEGGAR